MSYSALYIKKSQKTLLILGVVSLISLLMGGLFFISRLSQKNGWKKIEGIKRAYVVNRSPHGFEVVWSTKNRIQEEQWMEAGEEKGTYPIKSRIENNGDVYRATITGLSADTAYYFRIRISDKTYILPSLLSDKVHTPKEVKEKPVSPSYGKVLLPSTRPYANGLLMYEIEGYHPLAVFTKETGEWLLPLTGLIEKKSNTITSVSDSVSVLITLFSYPEGTIRTTISQTRPLKQAILAGSSVHLAQTIQGKGEVVLGANSSSSLPRTNSPLSSIIYPKENALIPGNTPLIRGTAPVERDVTILIQATTKQYSYRTKSDEKGDWMIQYPLVLDSGRYTIVATIENANGTPTILKRSFSIIKSGEKVLGVATGTPTLIPTFSPVPTYISTNQTITPISTIAPTTILPTRFVPTAPPPVTGGGVSLFLFGALFCIVIGAGLILAF